MKKLLFLFILSLVFGAAKAQMTITANGTWGDPVNSAGVYTDNGNSWEATYTDPVGNTFDFSWSLNSSHILSYTYTVTAPTGQHVVGVRDVQFYDEGSSTLLMEGGYEGDGMGGYDCGSNYWSASDSFDISTLGTSGTIDISLDERSVSPTSGEFDYSWGIGGTLEYPL